MNAATAFDLDAYLDRIGYVGPLEPTLDTLDGILTAHLSHIPFENLDVVLGRGIALDMTSIVGKLVTARRGGYCFEQNRLLATALRTLGFMVTDLAARVRPPGATEVMARSHMLLRVDIGDVPWLADVGFGAGSPLHPVPLDGTPVHELGRAYQVGRENDEYVLRAYEDDTWQDCYSFTLEPAHPADYEQANHFTSTHPSSPFVRGFTAQLSTVEARHVIRGRTYTRRAGRDEQARELDASALTRLLTTTFGLALDRIDLDALSAWWDRPAEHPRPEPVTS